jgi:Carboxypeptidase regulatory-like domain
MQRYTRIALALFTLPNLPALHAQGLLGTILGTVTDATGASIGGATVKARSLATNLEVTAQTKDGGLYQVPNLPIGTYSLTISKTGFQTEVHSQIIVQAERSTTVNAVLQVGAVTQTVEVSATPLVNEVDTTNGYVLDESVIRNTPLGTGSFTQLAILSPGVNADFLAGTGSNAGLGNQAIWANGQRDSSNSFMVNGISANNLFNGKSGSQVSSSRFTLNTGQGANTAGTVATSTSAYDAIGQALPTPPVETLQEVRVNTSMYDATQSANSGAHIALITKSGSNALHGEAYEYFQNNVFNAAPFFRNANTSIAASQKVPALHYNRFGATLGGLIVKDKLFFFGSWQSHRVSDLLGGTSTITVPQHLTDDRGAAPWPPLRNRIWASRSIRTRSTRWRSRS